MDRTVCLCVSVCDCELVCNFNQASRRDCTCTCPGCARTKILYFYLRGFTYSIDTVDRYEMIDTLFSFINKMAAGPLRSAVKPNAVGARGRTSAARARSAAREAFTPSRCTPTMCAWCLTKALRRITFPRSKFPRTPRARRLRQWWWKLARPKTRTRDQGSASRAARRTRRSGGAPPGGRPMCARNLAWTSLKVQSLQARRLPAEEAADNPKCADDGAR